MVASAVNDFTADDFRVEGGSIRSHSFTGTGTLYVCLFMDAGRSTAVRITVPATGAGLASHVTATATLSTRGLYERTG